MINHWIHVSKGKLSFEEYALVVRELVGDNPSEGGLPLPDGFRAIAERLLEEPPKTGLPESELVKAVRNAGAIPLKEKRILSIWLNWENFTRALLVLLKQKSLVVHHPPAKTRESTWTLARNFAPGRRYVMITLPERGVEIGFIALLPQEKERRNRAQDYIKRLRRLRTEIEEDGLLLAEIEEALDHGIMVLEKGKAVRRSVRVGSPDPMVNQPDRVQMCTKCHKDKPLTSDYFASYGPTRGLYYWERECITCSAESHSNKSINSGIVRKGDVRKAILSFGEGKVPSPQEVVLLLGVTDEARVRKYWDDLANEGRVPPRSSGE